MKNFLRVTVVLLVLAAGGVLVLRATAGGMLQVSERILLIPVLAIAVAIAVLDVRRIWRFFRDEFIKKEDEATKEEDEVTKEEDEVTKKEDEVTKK